MNRICRVRGAALAATILLAAAPLRAQELSGVWCDQNGTPYTIRQSGTDLCWHMDGLPAVENVFCGSVIGRFVVGRWLDLPGGRLLGGGQLILSVDSPDRMTKTYQEGDYGGSVWTRAAGGRCPGLPAPNDPSVHPGGGAGSTGGRPIAPPPPPPPLGSSGAGTTPPPPPPPPPPGGTTAAPRTNAPPPPPPPSSRTTAPRSNVPPPPTTRSSAPPPATGGLGSLPPRPGSWRLVGLEQRGSMDDRPPTPGDGGLRFDVRRFDATGGEVLVTVTYASPALCPVPESETLLYRWSFPADMRYLAPGQEFAVDVTVEPYSQSRTCPTGVFGRSEVVVMRSEGSVEDISPAERPGYWPVFTHPYVRDGTGVRLNFYVGGAQTGRALLRVNDERPPMSSRRGSYSIRFYSNACCGTPTPANNWSFHYFYEY